MPKVTERRLQYFRENLSYNLNRTDTRYSTFTQDESVDNYAHRNNQQNRSRNPGNISRRTVKTRRQLLDELRQSRRELFGMKRQLRSARRMECPVCYRCVKRNRVIYLAECGHGACRSCLVQSVVNSALLLLKYSDIETIDDSWRCFLCRMDNRMFCCFHGEHLQVKDVTGRTDLREEMKRRYREQLHSARVTTLNPLPPGDETTGELSVESQVAQLYNETQRRMI